MKQNATQSVFMLIVVAKNNAVMLSVANKPIMLSDVMLSDVMVSVVMLSFVMLDVVMLDVMAPPSRCQFIKLFFFVTYGRA
jgi:hypothetical protein